MLIAGLLLIQAAALADPVSSPFALACLGSGGMPGRIAVTGGPLNLRLYGGNGVARIGLALAPADGVSFVEIARVGMPNTEPPKVSLRPGDAVVFTASQLTVDASGGTVGKAVEYCLRVS